MTSPLRLTHIHLPRLTPYLHASAIQERFVRRHLDYKARPSTNPPPPPPDPTLLTFSTPPTYTCGRREIAALSDTQKDFLRADGKAEFHEALRGGQTTFHGPGQLTAYLVCSLDRHGLSARSFVQLLEESVGATIGEYGLKGVTREDAPGVWVDDTAGGGERKEDVGVLKGEGAGETGGEKEEIEKERRKRLKKIASLGVHLRRRVSSHGIGLNVGTNLDWFERITACGLPGNLVTSMERQIKKGGKGAMRKLEIDAGTSLGDLVRQLEGAYSMREHQHCDQDNLDISQAMMTYDIAIGEVSKVIASFVAKRLQEVDGRFESRVIESDEAHLQV